MACINPDGTLSVAAKKILTEMQAPTTLEDVAKQTELPLYRIRSSIRIVVEAGLVEEMNGEYRITEAGQARLDAET